MVGFLRSRNYGRRTIESAMSDAARRNPYLRVPLTDPDIRAWIRDFYAYLDWSFHGNQNSPYDLDYFLLVRFLAGQDGMEGLFEEDMDLPQVQDLFVRRDALMPRMDAILASFDEGNQPVGAWGTSRDLPGVTYSGPFQIYFDDEEDEYVLVRGDSYGTQKIGWFGTLWEATSYVERRGH